MCSKLHKLGAYLRLRYSQEDHKQSPEIKKNFFLQNFHHAQEHPKKVLTEKTFQDLVFDCSTFSLAMFSLRSVYPLACNQGNPEDSQQQSTRDTDIF